MPEEIESFTSRRLNLAIDQLCVEFQGIWGRETIARFVKESEDSLVARRPGTLNFLPLMATRFARERLQALAQAEGLVEKEHPEVLFVCVHNAGRSQIAAALTTHISRGEISVRSAGSMPGEDINPAVIAAMAEEGLDVRQEFPKPLTDEFVRAADVVVTMGCGDACPIYPGKLYEDWEIPDPSGQPVETVRLIVGEIRGRVEGLVAGLRAPAAPAG